MDDMTPDDISEFIDAILPQLDVERVGQLSPFLCAKPRKDRIGEWLCDSLCTLSKLNEQFRKLKSATEPLKTELIKSQQQIISLQSELLASKNDQIQSLQSTVKNSVEESVKAEFVTYSSKLQAPAPALAAETVKSFVKTVVEEEDRSRSLMVFGLTESDNEQLSDNVNELFQDIGEKPRFEASRLGKTSSSGSSRKVRPIKVTFSSSTIATHILSKSRNLRKTVNFRSVFICPDRSPDQRVKHRELVLEMKSRAQKEPGKSHFIRRGTVCSIDPTVK